jgi:hypothetical protein
VHTAVLSARSSCEVASSAVADPEDVKSESEYDYEPEDDHAPVIISVGCENHTLQTERDGLGGIHIRELI